MTFDRVVAGHRVLRLLADGARSQVWLAAGDIVLKVLTPPVAVDSPGLEVEALHRARGDHVVELLDLSVDGSEAVLVLPRLPRGSLADVLRRRESMDAGEAVTVLAPLATCLTRLHAAGIAHRGLSASSVMFRADGAPVLTGFGAAELFEPALPEVGLEKIAGVASDRAALLGLADTVLARTSGARGKAAARLRADLRETPPEHLAGRMARELFELAAARPVAFDLDPIGLAAPAGRVVDVAEVAQVAEPAEGPITDGMRMWVERAFATGPASVARAALREQWARWSATQRRMVLAGGAACLAAIVAVAAVPGSTAPTAPALVVPPDPSTSPPADDSDDDDAVAEGDPVGALSRLAQRRDGCFRDLSVLCLDGVDEPGSSAFDADRATLQAILDGGDAPRPLHVAVAVLTERLGDSALIDLGADSDPASVLLLKGEAGWRIRDYLAPLGAGETDGG